MAARTVLTTQPLNSQAGITLPFIPVDVANGHQVRNSGVQVVVCITGGASSVNLKFASVADAFGRTADLVVAQGASLTRYYGPFAPSNIWGDGASQLFIDPSALSGTASIAVISI